MELISQEFHPNGFKISLAAYLNGKQVKQTKSKGSVEDGASLHLQADDVTGTKFALTANSAVLFLFSCDPAKSPPMLDWLHWEASELQRCVHRVVFSASSGRPDAAAVSCVTGVLGKLETHLATPKQPWIAGTSIGASDVVVLGSLLPLCSVTAVKLPSNVDGYIQRASQDGKVKSCIKSWYGCDAPSNIPLVSCPAPAGAASAGASTWQLTKNKTAAPAATGKPPTTGPTTAAVQPCKEERRISTAEVSAAETGWRNTDCAGRTKPRVTPVLPVKDEKNILITSALPYVNNVPHLGNIIGCVLSADCFARFCRLRQDNVIYICGTDEYGTATETKAIAENTTPKAICDKYHKIHSDVYKAFNISFDHFGRTSTQNQTDIVHELFWDLEKNGNISRKSVEQLYCDACERFLADRFVEGICPHIECGYEDARGDQCDACGKLVDAAELGKPRCKLCSATPRIKSSDHLFIDLPKIETDLRKWFDVSSKRWSRNAGTICSAWLRDGLLPRCITRDLKWGVPVPLEGYQDKVFYVWFDAPIGYLSITKEYTKDWDKWWKNPDQVQLYQFMAKDNVPFHGIIFPCTLTGSPKTWTRVTNLEATEYLNYEDGKFSKSRGVGVFGDEAMSTCIPSDVWRFYLLYIRPEAQDTAFAWTDLQMKNNTELLNNLGNFVNRALKFVAQFYNGVVPDASPSKADFTMMAAANFELAGYTTALGNVKLRDGIRHILAITKIGNQYIQDNEPYKLIKADRSEEDKKRGATVITVAVNLVYLVALLLEPYMPETSGKILSFLNLPSAAESCLPSKLSFVVKPGNKVTEPVPLIKKITDDEIMEWQLKFKGEQDPAAATKAKPGAQKSAAPSSVVIGASADSAQVDSLEKLVADQASKVRTLKAGGASKADVAPEVATLLSLKKQQLAEAMASAKSSSAATGGAAAVERLEKLVADQGDEVRTLNTGGASKADIAPEVATLLSLKQQLAQAKGEPVSADASGKKKKGGQSKQPSPPPAATNGAPAAIVVDQAEVDRLQASVTQQGDAVRTVKSSGASKDEIGVLVAKLLQLKMSLATAQGIDPATLVSSGKGKKKK